MNLKEKKNLISKTISALKKRGMLKEMINKENNIDSVKYAILSYIKTWNINYSDSSLILKIDKIDDENYTIDYTIKNK